MMELISIEIPLKRCFSMNYVKGCDLAQYEEKAEKGDRESKMILYRIYFTGR